MPHLLYNTQAITMDFDLHYEVATYPLVFMLVESHHVAVDSIPSLVDASLLPIIHTNIPSLDAPISLMMIRSLTFFMIGGKILLHSVTLFALPTPPLAHNSII